jgi:hypothetical protein
VAVVLSLLLVVLVVAVLLHRRRSGYVSQKVGTHTSSEAAFESPRTRPMDKAGSVKGDAFDMTMNPLYKKDDAGVVQYSTMPMPIHYAIPLEDTGANVYGQCTDVGLADTPATYDAIDSIYTVSSSGTMNGGGGSGGNVVAQTPQVYNSLQRLQPGVFISLYEESSLTLAEA